MSEEQIKAFNVLKRTNFGGNNGIILEIRKEHLIRLGVLEAYQKIYPNAFHEHSNNHSVDFLTIEEAWNSGILRP